MIPSWQDIAQLIEVSPSSDNTWGVTPLSLDLLSGVLLEYGNGSTAFNDGDVTARLLQQFTRPAPTTATTIVRDVSVPLPRDTAVVFYGAYGRGVYVLMPLRPHNLCSVNDVSCKRDYGRARIWLPVSRAVDVKAMSVLATTSQLQVLRLGCVPYWCTCQLAPTSCKC